MQQDSAEMMSMQMANALVTAALIGDWDSISTLVNTNEYPHDTQVALMIIASSFIELVGTLTGHDKLNVWQNSIAWRNSLIKDKENRDGQ